ncbi:MAG: hypothetical protein GY749_28355 [Desulfobacteraceae bacterium]|nr:hypothetical protein [Desulfobacteraceae bacterium]
MTQLLKMTSDLTEIADSLEAVIKNAEPRFLKIGQELEALYFDANELAQLTAKSANSIGGESDENLLNIVGKLARQALEELQSCRSGIAESLDNIDEGAGHLDNLCNICSVIEKTGIFLHVVGLNMGVESSRSKEASEMFEVLVHEVKQLAQRVLDISRNIYDDSRSARARQLSAQSKILKGLDELSRLNEVAEKTVQNTVEEIRNIMKLSLNALERTSIHSKEISRQVSEIVVAIQFHDITRQQIEHIVHTLREWADILGRQKSSHFSIKPGKTFGTGKAKTLGSAHAILRLQAVQLTQVIEEIVAAYRKSAQAFEKLGNQVGELVTDVSVLNSAENGKQENRIELRIEALKSDLQHLRILQKQGHSLKSQIGETAEQVSETASNLSHHISQVQGISLDLHLKALNAIVKSERLKGEGRTFEILAQKVSELSKQSNEFVADVVNILEAIIGLAKGLQIGSYSEMCQFDMIEWNSEISCAYDQFIIDSSKALQDSGSLQEATFQTKSDLFFLHDLADELTMHLGKLEKGVTGLESWAGKDLHHSVKAEIRQVAGRYTMKRERDIHGQYIEGGKPAKLPEPMPSAEDNNIREDEDLGDNVELF